MRDTQPAPYDPGTSPKGPLKVDTLQKLVEDNFKRTEILDYTQRDFQEYAWSIHNLDRRLRYLQNGKECLSRGSSTCCPRRNIRPRVSLRIS